MTERKELSKLADKSSVCQRSRARANTLLQTNTRLGANHSPAAVDILGQFPPILFETSVWTLCGALADVAKRTDSQGSSPNRSPHTGRPLRRFLDRAARRMRTLHRGCMAHAHCALKLQGACAQRSAPVGGRGGALSKITSLRG